MVAPEDARPLFRLGNALFATQQFHDSQEAFSQALSFASLPEDAALLPKLHVNLGISLEAEGQLELACQHYRYCLCATVEVSCSLRYCSNIYKRVGATCHVCLNYLSLDQVPGTSPWNLSQVSNLPDVSQKCLKCNGLPCF